ncbi:MAG: fumarylacetoacetate hydrolase family protein [Propionibacteriaceae bacterium]|jgi:acylpyruvate hydrolase|nr:fumarylacetoacetate hydrolase family protein [Propionibacteriaceae bacterium]
MRLIMFDAGFGPRFGALLDSRRALDLPGLARHVGAHSDDPRDAALPALVPDDSVAFLRLGVTAYEAVQGLLARVACAEGDPASAAELALDRHIHTLDRITLLAPVLAPEKIIGIGMNYRPSTVGPEVRLPKNPLIFAKWNNTLVGPKQEIVVPQVSQEVDYEAELAVIIGRRAKNVSEVDALDYVAGYTVANDVTARDVQAADRQWVRGKTSDTMSPLGPAIVTPDEIADINNLQVRLWLNGEKLQDGNTEMLIFGIPTLVSFLSHSFTLQPGDVILTGTPAGVGFKREPQVFLKHGDRVRVSVDVLGELDNPVVAEVV